MAWIIGIDEAGYGPNLGPFIMTSVACRVPDALVSADLWRVLRRAVRRHGGEDDGRLVLEDSKLVHSGAHPFRDLERNVLAALVAARTDLAVGLGEYLDRFCPAARADLAAECWFAGTLALPVLTQPDDYLPAAQRFSAACEKKQLTWGLIRSHVLCPGRFNALLDRWGSKGSVLSLSLIELVQCNCDPADDGEPMFFLVDKHGGRNNYAAVLQHGLPDGVVLAHEEGQERSAYTVVGLRRKMHLTFEPRADSTHLVVALASMLSKYLRELLMLEFNRFWQNHVPDLKPTAGYPGDSARYFDAIRPAAERLGIPEAALWRRK
jgi:hypothetical protein